MTDPLALGMILLEGLAFWIALCVGSFLNVVIWRMPRDFSVVHPGSHCPSCGHAIRPWDNIPVFSWLVLLRGKCRDCGVPISSLYPTIELLTGIVGWLIFRRIIPGPESLDLAHGLAFGMMLILAGLLIAIAFIDLRYRIIPLELSIYIAPFFVLGWWGLGALGYAPVTWRSAVVAAMIGMGALAGMSLVWRLVRGYEAVGRGDMYLCALIGAGVGLFPGLVYVLVAGSMFGLIFGVFTVVARRHLMARFAYGPSLAAAGLLYLTHGPLGIEGYARQMQAAFQMGN